MSEHAAPAADTSVAEPRRTHNGVTISSPYGGSEMIRQRPGQSLEDYLRVTMDYPVLDEDMREIVADYDPIPNLDADADLYVHPQRFVEIEVGPKSIKLTPTQAVIMARHLLASAKALDPRISAEDL